MSNYLQIFITLLSLLNPILALGQYIDMTKDLSHEARKKISIVCGISVFVILGVFLFIGQYIMDGLSIHPYSLRLGGGVILLILGIKIVLGGNITSSDRMSPETKVDVSNVKRLGVSPLAIPMVIGPASMVMVIIYGQDAKNIIDKLAIVLILAILAGLISVTFLLANYVAKAIGDIGITVITKSMGLVITAIAFEMMIAGMQTVVPIIEYPFLHSTQSK